MIATKSIAAEKKEWEAAAVRYFRSLPPEHTMESTKQSTQRQIALTAFELIKAKRPEVKVFSELLIQYRLPGKNTIQRVVPDNMIVVHPEPIHAVGHFTLALQPAKPIWVMEYVSNSSRRKDYVKSMEKYETELKVLYYLVFYPDAQELSLFRLEGFDEAAPLEPGEGRVQGAGPETLARDLLDVGHDRVAVLRPSAE